MKMTQVSSAPAGEHHRPQKGHGQPAVDPPSGSRLNPPTEIFKQLLTIPQRPLRSSLNRQRKQGRLQALQCLSHLRALWPRTNIHTHIRYSKTEPPRTSCTIAAYPIPISHLLVHTCARAAEKWAPGVRSGVIHHAASGRSVDIRKGTRSAAIVIESPCLF